MLTKNFSIRVAGPTILMSLLLMVLCIAVAIFLFSYESTSADVLGENVNSATIAHDLENTLHDLVALLKERKKQVGPVQQRIGEQLAEARQLADKETERQLVTQLENCWDRYLKTWPVPGGIDAVTDPETFQAARRLLENQAIPICGKLQEFNAQQVKESETAHRKTVQWVLAGLACVGGIGSLAGLLLGYGMARGLRRSLHQLTVRVRDAADKLGQDLPTVVLTEEGDLQQLHDQMQGLVREIEQVVAKLQQREHEVLRAEQLAAVGQLAAGVAHELRNPLTSIKMLVQTNREEAESRGLPAEDLRIMELEIRRVEQALQTFLDFARPPKPERRPLNLAESIDRTLALIGGRARKQHVALHVSAPDVPFMVEADPDQIHQLLINLALNALDAMPRGGTLEMALRSPTDGQIEIQVRDSGSGIPPDILPRLFNPFISSKETGLGLGLVISQRIAESHGGSLTAANRSEGGACFTLRLPVGDFNSHSQNRALKDRQPTLLPD
jgi:two-component system, NtrC family, sensor histidine kinase HydH